MGSDTIGSGYAHYREVAIDSCGKKIVLSLYEHAPESANVIFLPGTMTHPLFYDTFLSLLASKGFNIIGVHFTGHGKSPASPLFTVTELVQNVKDAITYTRACYGGPIILLGSSQGGIVAMAAAANETRIAAVFTHDLLYGPLKETAALTAFPQWSHRFYRLVPLFLNWAAALFPAKEIALKSYLDPERLDATPELMERFVNDPLGRVSYPLRFVASLFSLDQRSMTDGSIVVPVVVLAGREDRLFPFDYIQKVFGMIRAPKKELLTFEGCGHLLFIKHGEEVVGRVAEKLFEYSRKSPAGELSE